MHYLEKIDNDDKSKNNSSPPHSSPNSLASDKIKSDLDLLRKLQSENL